MSAIPGIVTHNYDPLHGPFRNICTLSDAEAQHVLDTIALSGKRLIRENYLRRRRRTETWLLSERQRKMGAPVTEHPIYFFLGDRADGLDRSRPESIVSFGGATRRYADLHFSGQHGEPAPRSLR